MDVAADDADEGGVAGPVGAQQREYLAALYVQVDVLQGLVSGRVCLGQALYGNDGLHADLGLAVKPLILLGRPARIVPLLLHMCFAAIPGGRSEKRRVGKEGERT